MSIETYVNNLRNSGQSNYRTIKLRMQSEFAKLDIASGAAKFGLTEKDGAITLRLFDRQYRVNTDDGSVTADDGSEAGFNESMIIYDLIGYASGTAAACGEYVMIQNLSQIQNASSFAGKGMFSWAEKEFGGKTRQLTEACRRLGGEPYGRGDVSFRIPMFHDLWMVFSYWNADDEFPASVNPKFDRNTCQYMHYETVWYAASLLLDCLRKEIS